MATAQRKTRKQLLKEPDEFLTTYVRVERYVRERPKLILGVIIAVVVVVLGVNGIINYRRARFAKATAAFSDALAELKTENADAAQQAAAIEKLQTIIKKYSTLPSATLARQAIAAHFYAQSKYAQAAESFQALAATLTPESSSLWELAQLGYAQSLHAQKNYDEAIVAYRRIIDHPRSRSKATALLGIARCYEKKKDTEAALKTYSEVQESYPDAPLIDLSFKIESLKAQLAASQG